MLDTVYKFDVPHIKVPAFYIRAQNDSLIPSGDVKHLFNMHQKNHPFSKYKEVSGTRTSGRDVQEQLEVVSFFKKITEYHHKKIDNQPINQAYTYDEVEEDNGEELEVGLDDLNIKI